MNVAFLANKSVYFCVIIIIMETLLQYSAYVLCVKGVFKRVWSCSKCQIGFQILFPFCWLSQRISCIFSESGFGKCCLLYSIRLMCELFLSCSTFTANSLAMLELIPFSPNKMCGFKDGRILFWTRFIHEV